MRSPTLDELPSPPSGKTGWLWTEASAPLPDTMPDGNLWLKVSIVTPSYNQAQFLEETIRSVLLQGYPNLEYIIIDGGSTDNSVEIIRQYENWLTYWVSEKDRGQSEAINKGFARATGEICAWLNSDDVYYPGAVSQAVQYFDKHSDTLVVYGDSNFVDADSSLISRFQVQPFRPPQMFFDHFIPQPSVFISRWALEKGGGLDDSWHFCMDYDLWLRVALCGRIDYTPQLWSKFRVHPASKGSNLQALRWEETAKILEAFFMRADIPNYWRKYRSQGIGRAHWHSAIEFYRNAQRDPTVNHVHQAIQSAPDYVRKHAFAGMLVGGLADCTTEESSEFADDFFSLIPDSVASKSEGHRRAHARVNALLALNNSTPPKLARRFAFNALKLDQFWLRNRHVLRRAIW